MLKYLSQFFLRLFLCCLVFCNFASASSIFDFLSKGSSKEPVGNLDEEPMSDFLQDRSISLSDASFASLGEAKLIAINKITASRQKLTVKVNQPVFFHNIEINLHKYIKQSDPYNSDSYALVTLTEYKTNDDPKILFQGWLIQSSPSISTFNSPIYEVFIQDP